MPPPNARGGALAASAALDRSKNVGTLGLMHHSLGYSSRVGACGYIACSSLRPCCLAHPTGGLGGRLKGGQCAVMASISSKMASARLWSTKLMMMQPTFFGPVGCSRYATYSHLRC